LVDQAHACKTAAEIAKVLSDRGPAIGRSCAAPACPLTTSGT
jgi:hypothetical protein